MVERETVGLHSTYFTASFIKGSCVDSVSSLTDTYQPSLIVSIQQYIGGDKMENMKIISHIIFRPYI